MGGVNYNKGYSMSLSGYSSVSFNLQGKYRNIKGLIGLDDSEAYDREVIILGDNEELARIQLSRGELPVPLDLDVTNVHNLVIKVGQYDSYHSYAQVDFADLVIR
jgi:hypothetical protein